MSTFLTRPGLAQPQPSVAQLPFSQFGGQRPALQPDTTGGIAFPNAGQPQPQPTESPLSPFMLPTGLSPEELNALLGAGGFTEGQLDGFGLPGFDQFGPSGPFQPQIQQSATQQSPTLPIGGIPFEGSSSPDKFNPLLAGGTPVNNLNLGGTTAPSSTFPEFNLLGNF